MDAATGSNGRHRVRYRVRKPVSARYTPVMSGLQIKLICRDFTGHTTTPETTPGALVMKGSPVRVRASALRRTPEAVRAAQEALKRARGSRPQPKLRKRIPEQSATAVLELLARGARIGPDVPQPPARCKDPADDYLLALAEAHRAALVSGDKHLLALRDRFPVFTAADFLDWLDRHG